MKKLISGMVILGAVMAASVPAQAADRKVMLPIADAMAANDAQNRLGDSIKFYFGNQRTPRILQRISAEKTSQKTNSFGKSTEKACNWVFLSAMLQLQKHAAEVGANAVVGIVSNYNNIENSSTTEFECHDGAMMSGVALKGEFVKVADK